MDLGIALVAYNIKKQEVDVLNKSLFGLELKYLVVYDNSTSDIARDMFVKSGWEYNWNGKNLGFGKAHNFLFEKYNNLSRYHLIINPDVSFEVSAINNLIGFLNYEKEAGCVMPKILYPNGSNQYLAKYLPSFLDFVMRRSPFLFIKNFVDRKLEIKNFYNQDKPFKAPFLSGCFLLFRNDCVRKIGFFDQRFFLYAEDLDLTRRFWDSTCYPYCYPKAQIYHNYEKASSKSFYLLFIHLSSLVKYYLKWGFFEKKRKYINKVCSNQILK
jgi:GT2 family glycosyltransferase